ncbi:hypothetical protein V8E54_009007 [Elaphomyces granulatus]
MASERILEGDSLGKCDSPPSEDLNITDLAVDCAKLFTRALDYINTTDEAPRLKGPLEELQRRFCDWATYLGVSENTVIDRILRIGYRDLFLLALDMLRFNILHFLPPEETSFDGQSSDDPDDSDSGDVDSHKIAFEGIHDAICHLNRFAMSIRLSY